MQKKCGDTSVEARIQMIRELAEVFETKVPWKEQDMSSNFYIKLKKKGVNVKDSPTIFTMGTTPTRELTSELNFVYADGNDYFWKKNEYDLTPKNVDKSLLSEYDEYSETTYTHGDGTSHVDVSIFRWHVLDNELLNDAISYYKTNLDNIYKYKQRYLEDIKRYEKMACNSTSVDVAHSFMEKISELELHISEYEEDEEVIKYYHSKWINLSEILEEANVSADKPEYELVYWHD